MKTSIIVGPRYRKARFWIYAAVVVVFAAVSLRAQDTSHQDCHRDAAELLCQTPDLTVSLHAQVAALTAQLERAQAQVEYFKVLLNQSQTEQAARAFVKLLDTDAKASKATQDWQAAVEAEKKPTVPPATDAGKKGSQ